MRLLKTFSKSPNGFASFAPARRALTVWLPPAGTSRAEGAVAVVPRVFDENPVVRRVAKLALRGLAEAQPGLVVDTLGAIAKGREQPTVRRTRAVEALGETR